MPQLVLRDIVVVDTKDAALITTTQRRNAGEIKQVPAKP